MSDSIEARVVAQADAAAGRVVPGWRYWFGFLLVLTAWIASGVIASRDAPMWVGLVILFVLLTAYQLLMRKFKKRTIR